MRTSVGCGQTLAGYIPAARPHIREAGEAVEIYSRSYATREQLAHDFTAMAARGVGMLFVYSGGYGSDHARNYAGQFFDIFPTSRGEPRIKVEYFEKADHVFTVLADREIVFGSSAAPNTSRPRWRDISPGRFER